MTSLALASHRAQVCSMPARKVSASLPRCKEFNEHSSVNSRDPIYIMRYRIEHRSKNCINEEFGKRMDNHSSSDSNHLALAVNQWHRSSRSSSRHSILLASLTLL